MVKILKSGTVKTEYKGKCTESNCEFSMNKNEMRIPVCNGITFFTTTQKCPECDNRFVYMEIDL